MKYKEVWDPLQSAEIK